MPMAWATTQLNYNVEFVVLCLILLQKYLKFSSLIDDINRNLIIGMKNTWLSIGHLHLCPNVIFSQKN